jgi:hypothetical protein
MKATPDYLRRQAAACRQRAESASPSIAKALRAMADEYEEQARKTEANKQSSRRS